MRRSAPDQSLQWFPWYFAAARADRRWARISWQARAFLFAIYEEAWKEGGVKDDRPHIAEIIGCTVRELEEQWDNMAPLLFEVRPGVLSSHFLEKLRTERDHERVRNATNGRKGGLAKSKEQGDLLAGLGEAKPVEVRGKREEERGERKEEESNGDSISLADVRAIRDAWNAMADVTKASKIIAIKGERSTHFRARLREPGWVALALRAILYLGTDPWYREHPDAIRFDVLIRSGKAEEYVEKSQVQRSSPGASSRGGARSETDAGIHDELRNGRGALADA